MDYKDMGFSTKALHAGQYHDPVTGAHVSPIYQTSTMYYQIQKKQLD